MNFKKHFKTKLFSFFYRNKRISPPQKDELKIWQGENSENIATQKIPKIIWTYWNTPTLPAVVKACIKSWEVQNPDFEINLLTPENILDFLPAFKKENLQLSPANFSDLVRLQLLKKYGGFWLDATIIINDSLNQYIKLIEHEDLNLLAFSSKDHPNHKDYPMIESWFLGTHQENELISSWLHHLEQCFENKQPEDYFKSNTERKIGFESVKENRRDYLYVYMASQVAMREVKNVKVGLLSTEKNGLFYQNYFHFNHEKLAKFLLLQTHFTKFPSVIKLIAINRIPINEMIEKKIFHPKSILGRHLRDYI